jgi:hypothetical protein
MKSFQYEVVMYPADDFKDLVYFCKPGGECQAEQVPGNQLKLLRDILAERGKAGWELVQTVFGKDGVLIFWKKEN